MKGTLLAAAAALALATGAHAATILTFGQATPGNTITGTSTTISGSAIPITIDDIITGGTPISADLTLSATSSGAATLTGGHVTQLFSGSFSITSGATDYLSGTFNDAVFGSGTSLTLSASNATAGESVSFSSSVIPASDLGSPRAISLSFANVTPDVAVDVTTLGSFSSDVSGDFSAASVPVRTPEPASIALLGAGLLGLGFIGRRRTKR